MDDASRLKSNWRLLKDAIMRLAMIENARIAAEYILDVMVELERMDKDSDMSLNKDDMMTTSNYPRRCL